MRRVAEAKLIKWKNSTRRKPLVIRGARQVGKTWLIENVLAKEFEQFVKVDFETRRDLHKYFEKNLEPAEILKGLEFFVGKITPGKTLLFFDEIQACPRAIMALRYFYEDMPDLHIVAAGSLLEFAFGEISVPVGRIQYLYLYPMTFYEYLNAIGKEAMAELTLQPHQKVDKLLQDATLNELKNYFFIGGMPESVKTYRDTNSFLDVFEMQNQLLDSYREDFAKYKPSVDTTCLDAVFLNAAKSVGEQLKYTHLNEWHSYMTNHKAFDLLVKAKILHKIPACNPSGLPLGATANQKKFKACMLDIGLLQRLCQVPVNMEINRSDLLAIYQGKLAEQFVAQELIAWGNRDLYYWARNAKNSSAEIDYLTIMDGQIYPIEVKSGAAGKLKSMHLILKEYPNCPNGIVLYSGNYKELTEQKLTFMPLYMTAQIGGQMPS